MAIPQTTVNFLAGVGIPGELATNGPLRANPYILISPDAANNVVGRACTISSNTTSPATVRTGGTGVFVGFLAAPKSYANYGTLAGGPLAPTLILPNNLTVDVVNMGELFVNLPAAANQGDLVLFDNTTGDLTTIAPGADLPVGKTFANAVVDRYTTTAASTAVIRLTAVPVPPVPA